MTRIAAILRELGESLAALGADWALVGGLAVSARSEPRFTRDVDVVVVAAQDTSAERLVFELAQAGYRILATVEQTRTARLATARLLPPQESESGIIVDLLFASSGIEKEIVDAADSLDVLEGIRVPVSSAVHLLVLKLLARDDKQRPQDILDIRALGPVISDKEWEDALQAAHLIQDRGYHRGRDLVDELKKLEEFPHQPGGTSGTE